MENQCNTNNYEPCELSIIPTSPKKTPLITWKPFQSHVAPISLWHPHYLNDGYVGITCGKVSGGVECLDVDIKNDPTATINYRYEKVIPEYLYKKLLIQITPSGGMHLIYRCLEAIIGKSEKLAYSAEGNVIIETRGEGAYFCTHRNDYQWLTPGIDLANLEFNIPVITREERDIPTNSSQT